MVFLHPQLVEPTSHLGAMLKRIRQLRGWSLQDVAHATNIRIPILKQIEAHDYSGLLRGPYARSFVQLYARHLDLDITDCLDEIDGADPFADLDSCEYLKDHDEFVGDWTFEDESDPVPPESAARAPRGTSLLTGFASAFFATVALVGYLELDRAHAGESLTQARLAELPVEPLSGIPDTNPMFRSASARQSAPGSASLSGRNSQRPNSRSVAMNGSAAGGSGPSSVAELDLDQPPPRAIVVEE